MEDMSSDVPLPEGKRKTLRVGIVYNLQKESSRDDIPDEEAEYDSIETVRAIENALRKCRADVVLLEDDGNLPEKLKTTDIDIAFNIAEGSRGGGRGREAQVPALLDYYGIPYTGSDATALAVALDKSLTKRLVASYGVRVPRSVLVGADRSGLSDIATLKYPLIIKPDAEGSGKGISEVSIVTNEIELHTVLEKNLAAYRSDMLVEEYIDGKEYTVGIVGNGETAKAFSPMELRFFKHTQGKFDVYSYSVKKNYKDYIEYICPAPLSTEREKEMTDAALTVFRALDCHDLSRADFRTDAQGNVYFIEINPLPGLAPNYSDYPMLAQFCGTDYDTLISAVFDAAVKRLGL